MSLPRSALLTLWLNAALGGRVGPDDFAVAVRGDDPQHLLVDWADEPGPRTLEDLPGLVRRVGSTRVSLAVPVPGDLVGLAGPASFNAAAVDLGEAVVLDGYASIGLLPTEDARTVLWRATTAAPPLVLDAYEEGRQLRQTLLAATADLVRLDVASWQPEIPDLLLNLAHQPGLPLPPGLPAVAVEALERAVLCREIVRLARESEGGVLTVHETAERARCLTELDAAARRAMVAFCSASLSVS